MNTHDIEPLKYGGEKNDDYVTGWNDCYAAIEADRKRRGEPKDRRDIRGIVKKLQSAYVKDGSTDEWIRLRRHALEEAIDTLRLVSADCAHFYDAYKAACDRAPQPSEPVAPFHGKVERHSDQSVLVRFPSCRLASEFERNVAAYAEPVNIPLDKAGAVGHAFSLARRLCDGQPVEGELRNMIRRIAGMGDAPMKMPGDAEIGQILDEVKRNSRYGTHHWGLWREFALALLDRYGNPSKSTPEIDTSAQRVDPEWQDFPK